MGCMAEGHLKKHQRDFCLYHSECLAVAEYVINQNHRIHFSSTIVLAKLLHESNKVFLKAIEISLHQNFSREGGCHHWPGSPSSKFFRNREDVPVSLNPHIWSQCSVHSSSLSWFEPAFSRVIPIYPHLHFRLLLIFLPHFFFTNSPFLTPVPCLSPTLQLSHSSEQPTHSTPPEIFIFHWLVLTRAVPSDLGPVISVSAVSNW